MGRPPAVIAALGRVPELRVPGRASTFAFKGRELDVRTVGAQGSHRGTFVRGPPHPLHAENIELQVAGTGAASAAGVQLVGSLGVELNGDFDIGGSRVAPFLSATVEKELDDDPRTIRYAGTASPEIVNQWVVTGDDEPYGRVSLGANLQITNGLSVQVAGSTTIHEDGGWSSCTRCGAVPSASPSPDRSQRTRQPVASGRSRAAGLSPGASGIGITAARAMPDA